MTDTTLPPLPEPALTHDRHGHMLLLGPCFTADQMRAYKEAAVAAERERCTKLIETYPYWLGLEAKREIAAAIRFKAYVPPLSDVSET